MRRQRIMKMYPPRSAGAAEPPRDEAEPPSSSPPGHSDAGEAEARAAQLRRNQIAIGLLAEWRADDSGYDEQTWPLVKELLKRHPLSIRD